MQNPARAQLAALFPAIKADWITRLRGEPVLSPLGRPDTLAYLMDATLQQWALGLGAPDQAAWLGKCRQMAGSVHQHCACGLNPLSKYFATGAAAIDRVATPVLGPEAGPALHFFAALAHHEVELLCSLCLRPGHPGCALPPAGRPD